jgi:HlyD family secretion protein
VKILLIIAAVVVVGGGLASLGFMKLKGGGSTGPAEPTAVRVEKVAPGELIEIVSAPGQLQPKTKVSISAKTTARITDMPYEEGIQVKKGQLLVQLDSKDLEAQLKQSEAQHQAQAAEIEVEQARLGSLQGNIASAKAQLTDAERDLKRQKQLLSTSDVSQQAVDQAQTKVDQLQADLDSALANLEAEKASLIVSRHHLDAAEADIARAKDNLSYTTILSPIDGIVTRVNAKIGEMVVTGTMNNPGTVILEVADLSEMQVDAQIDESNIASVHEGQKAKIRISAYPDRTFDGTVKLVGLDVVDPRMGGGGGGGGGSSMQGRWYRARIVVDTKGKRIPAGLSADVDIETDVHKDALKVPTQAVMGRPVDELPQSAKDKPEVDKNKTLATVVFKFDNGKAVITPVTIGASDMTHTMVTSGLKAGDQVITGPYKVLPTLSDGRAVKEQNSPATTKASTQPATTKSSS